ncbi:beta-phosphoglucomutase [Spirochaeta lutea]|uniref:Beta-phosphoglucomutase n=1 Tax=Spirochaeta lutea TaxID=1480694 RepID=A0A098R023_9SPIO|nr:beta-phosphoglucomutase [Spirochaeta lutea]KGE73490.1 beta-phosphoglucomutase [Spirochaeta lutea]
MLESMKGALFDLDGVLVDTARYHYRAWKRLAAALGFDFTPEQNEELKGISRRDSLERLLAIGGVSLSENEKLLWLERKNSWYLEYIDTMGPGEVLPGAAEFLGRLKGRGIKIALGSASKNAPRIIQRIGLLSVFDGIIDGTKTSRSKPDPEVFLLGSRAIGVAPRDCIVFEDAAAGVQAGRAAGMRVVGIGSPGILTEADMVVPGLSELVWDR